MYNFSFLDKNNYIADDLGTINLNYRSLNDWTLSLESSAKNLWAPLVQLFNMRQPDWEFAITRTQQYSARWLDTATTVESYSSSWIKPLSLLLPNIYSSKTDFQALVYTISSWINTYFPVLVKDAAPVYVENQEALVYNYFQSDLTRVENLPLNLYASTTCVVYPGNGWANCTTRYSGTVNCNGGALVCDGQFKTCPVSKPVECQFTNPPYKVKSNTLPPKTITVSRTVKTPVTQYKTVNKKGIFNQILGRKSTVSYTEYITQTITEEVENPVYSAALNNKWSVGIGYIKAKLLFNYTDTREDIAMQCIKFRVKDCKWEYVEPLNKLNNTFIEPTTNGNCTIKIIDIASELKRGYYYVNNNGFITLQIKGIGRAVNDFFEININGISKLIPPGGSTVTFAGFYSRTYVAKLQNLTTNSKHSFTVSIGYVSGTSVVYQAYDQITAKTTIYKKGDTITIFT